jgi:hypothetical protein
LRAFIERFVPAWQGAFDYSKAHMESTSERIDVVISDGSSWLGIENKIFGAQEQNLQAERYLNLLHDAPSQNDYRLVYLSPRGAGPGPDSLTAEGRRVHGAHLVCVAPGRRPRDMATQWQRCLQAFRIGLSTVEINARLRTLLGL